MKRVLLIVLSIIGIALLSLGSLVIINSSKTSLKENKIKEVTKIIDSVKVSRNVKELKKAKNILKNYKLYTNVSLYKDITDLELVINKEKLLSDYSAKIKKFESNPKEEEVNKLKEEINVIKYDDIKLQLLDKIKVLEDEIARKKAEEARKKAEEERLAKEKAMKALDVPVYSRDVGAPVLETIVGNICAYASGSYRASGKVHYNDPTYGTVYVVAGDYDYPKGTIVRMKNVPYFGGKDIYAIVLDRGGIGKGKRYLFDLLFASEENMHKFGVQHNITCEILRYGY